MNLPFLETSLRWLAGLFAYTTLGILFYGIWRGAQRPAGRTTGHAGTWFRSVWFYLATSTLFFGICYIGWIPILPLIPQLIRMAMLLIGTLLYFPGMSLILWGRLTLGKYYFVSTGLGAQLFAGHQLITHGPFAIVRHPMYLGLMLAAVGSFLIYITWTTLFFAICAPFILLRARQEERILAAEFGEQWYAYCQSVPAFLPRIRTTTVQV